MVRAAQALERTPYQCSIGITQLGQSGQVKVARAVTNRGNKSVHLTTRVQSRLDSREGVSEDMDRLAVRDCEWNLCHVIYRDIKARRRTNEITFVKVRSFSVNLNGLKSQKYRCSWASKRSGNPSPDRRHVYRHDDVYPASFHFLKLRASVQTSTPM
jgi:hypothetical protein